MSDVRKTIYRNAVKGERVKPAYAALRSHLDERAKWMRWSSEWARADAALQKEAARRGTVTAETENKWARGLTVIWDDGRVSNCLPYMVEVASDGDA